MKVKIYADERFLIALAYNGIVKISGNPPFSRGLPRISVAKFSIFVLFYFIFVGFYYPAVLKKSRNPR